MRTAYRCPACREPRTREGLCRPCSRAGLNPGVVLPTKTPRPTRALPGSPQKVAVLERRCAAGEQLWHEKDGRLG